jgi:hypothetical protein
MTTKLALLVGAALTTAGFLVASPAGAGVPTAVTLQESVTFGDGHTRPVGVFTASGLPQCASGSFDDHLVNFNHGGHTLVIDRVYTCGGGTGSFVARMVLHISPPDENGDAPVGGEWTILDGSGALAGAHGAGTTNGVNSGCAPIGSLFAMCQTGVSTVVASVH